MKLINENRKNKKRKGLPYNFNPNAGDVEKGIEIFNKNIGSSEITGTAETAIATESIEYNKESTKNQSINIRSALNDIDKGLDKPCLVTLYDSTSFTAEQKLHIANMITSDDYNINDVYEYMLNIAENGAIAESLNEEKLEEKIPSKLANVYLKNTNTYRRSRDSQAIDYDKSTYEEIDATTALHMYKHGEADKLLVVVKDSEKSDCLVRFDSIGKKIVNHNFNVDQPFTNRNGGLVYDIKRLNVAHLFKIAEKIYVKNEVTYSNDILDKNKRQYDIASVRVLSDETGDNYIMPDLNTDGNWFIPDTGSHKNFDGRTHDVNGYRTGWMTNPTHSAYINIDDIKRDIEHDNNIINNYKTDKAKDRNLDMSRYLDAIYSAGHKKADLEKAKQRLRDERVLSRDISQISLLKTNRRALNRLRKDLEDKKYDLDRATDQLNNLTADRYASDDYKHNKSQVDFYRREINELKQRIAEYENTLKSYEDKISEDGINLQIQNATNWVNELTANSNAIQQEINKILKRK